MKEKTRHSSCQSIKSSTSSESRMKKGILHRTEEKVVFGRQYSFSQFSAKVTMHKKDVHTILGRSRLMGMLFSFGRRLGIMK